MGVMMEARILTSLLDYDVATWPSGSWQHEKVVEESEVLLRTPGLEIKMVTLLEEMCSWEREEV